MLCMPVCSTHYDSVYPGYPHIKNDDTSGCAPPLSEVWIRPWGIQIMGAAFIWRDVYTMIVTYIVATNQGRLLFMVHRLTK